MRTIIILLILSTSIFAQDFIKEQNDTANNYNNLYFSIYGGYSQRTGKISEDLNPYLHQFVDDLRTGIHYGGDLVYYTKGGWGFGVFYNLFSTLNSQDNVLLIDTTTGYRRKGFLSDKTKITFWGGVFGKRFKIDKRINLEVFSYFGYINYQEHISFDNNTTRFKANAFGQSFGGIANFEIIENIFIEAKILYLISSFNTATAYYSNGYSEIITLDNNSREDLSRVDLSLGLRFAF